VVEKVLTVDEPAQELLLLSDRLREPVCVSTERFGDLVLNPTVGWFEGKADWNGKAIGVSFEKGEDGGIGEALKTAEHLWSGQAAWKQEVEDFAVKKLLPLKNEAWLDDGEVPPTPKQFQARMGLVSITVGDNGRFEFWHDDGDLFWGHAIQVSGNLRDGVTEVDIPG
jgi:hypothetical protein